MDDKGFIFTIDATLALIVVLVLTASVTAYVALPFFQGEDHQHLEALADSALETMEQNGQLRSDAVYYSSGCSTYIDKANNDLNSTLNMLIPQGVAYSLTVNINGKSYPVSNTSGTRDLLTSYDQVTKVKVISGPQEGWMGRAYYKLDTVNFTTVYQNETTTVWNFHNWLTNFKPWNTNGLDTDKYWGGSNTGSGQTPVNIFFTVPGPVNSAQVLIGSAYRYGSGYGTKSAASPYNTDFYLNGALLQSIKNTSFQYLETTSSNSIYTNEYNYLGNIGGSSLLNGNNSFYLRFNSSHYNDMPWFSILANYNTSISVPQGTVFQTFKSNDIAGVGNPNGGVIYNPDTGQVTNISVASIDWSTLQSNTSANNNLNLNAPFELTNIPNINNGRSGPGSAVGTIMNVYLPNNTNLYDAFVVVNAYGGEDGALVQVQNSQGNWNTVFSSGSSTTRGDGGYGNIPGIISLYDKYNTTYQGYLTPGYNKVRVITWDDANSNDFDLVGLKNCYAQIAYSSLPIRWDDYCFTSYQNDNGGSSTKSLTESEPFKIDSGAQNAYLFVGAGLDTRNILVKCSNGTASNMLYNGSVPYMLDLASLDNAQTTKILSYVSANGTVLPKAGNYTLTVTITPSYAYESGDLGSSTGSYGYQADPEIYSGTRIAILYPQFLADVWAASFNDTAQGAMYNASQNLTQNLTGQDFNVTPSLMKTEAIWTGDEPNAIPIRLTLWKQ